MSSNSPAGDRTGFPIVQFLTSKDGNGRTWISTVGCSPIIGLEFQMTGVAPNHQRAAKFLMSICSRLIVDDPSLVTQIDKGVVLDLRPSMLPPKVPFLNPNPEIPPEKGAPRVKLSLEPMPGQGLLGKMLGKLSGREPWLIKLSSPEGLFQDSWLTATCRAMGQDAPDALPAGVRDQAMSQAMEKARASAADFRRQFIRGLPEGQHLGIKYGLTHGSGTEYVWLTVLDWSEEKKIRARLESQPRFGGDLKLGQELTISESDLCDFIIGGENVGIVFPGLRSVLRRTLVSKSDS